MANYTFRERIKSAAIKSVLRMIDENPEKNIPRILDWLEAFDRNNTILNQITEVRRAMEEQGHWYQLALSLWSDINDDQRKLVFHNFVINGNVIANDRCAKTSEKYGCNVPWAILMDPTSACNLKCRGCWAADYGPGMNMSLETLDDIVQQGKKLGVFVYLYSGGEPLVRKKDLITLCERHPDAMFLSFTNGTLIDDAFCRDLVRVKNFIPTISVEGFQKATDARRGEGTFDKLSEGMDLLKHHKLGFGVSCCYTSENCEEVGSEAYFDWMVDKGAKFAWFFTYMPVGVNAVPELMVSAEQRRFMFDKIREYRKKKPIFTMDFWNDGEFVDGCIAGGRRYLHINANGDIEPCAFIHYADSNVYETTLIEALQRPFFKAYQAGQPFNENMLRPCPLLDNKDKLARMVEQSGAKSTDLEHPEDVRELCSKCHRAADAWAPLADELWSSYEHWVVKR